MKKQTNNLPPESIVPERTASSPEGYVPTEEEIEEEIASAIAEMSEKVHEIGSQLTDSIDEADDLVKSPNQKLNDK